MDDWKYAQKNASEGLARLHYFTVKKKKGDTEIDVRITVKEIATPDIGALHFFAMADVPFDPVTKYQPSGWSNTLLGALQECMLNVRKFDYNGPEAKKETTG